MQHEQRPPKPVLVAEDCFAALIRDFMQSSKWTEPPPVGYSEATKDLWGRELRFAARIDTLGKVSLQEIRPALVQRFFDAFADRPAKQAVAMAALHQLEKWAVVRDLLPRQITTGVEHGTSKGGHTPWSDEQVALGEAKTSERISRAITLAANTGQRGSDLIRMGWGDVETYNGTDGINVRQKKTGKVVWIPITSTLASAMKTWTRQPGPFLRNADSQPWKRKQITDAWAYERASNPDIEELLRAGLVMHGLRGTACVRLRRAGATIPQIADMVGMSEDMVARYCRLSDQRENASAAVLHLERRILDMSKKVVS